VNKPLAQSWPRPSPQALVWTAVLLLAALTLAANASEVGDIARVLAAARLEYLGALFLVQAVFVVNFGLFYATTFRATGLPAPVRRFVLVSAASHFVNLVSKTSGFGGLALYLREGARTSQPPLKISAAYMAAYGLGYAAFLGILIVSVVLLYARGSLTRIEAVAATGLFVLVIVVSSVLATGLRSEAALERLFLAAVAPLNWLGRRLLGRDLVAADRLRLAAGELYESARLMRRRPGRYALCFGHALAVELVSALTLFLVARALRLPLGFDMAVAGYALSLLFAILSITPAGLGFVEASLAVFLASTGLNRQEAIAVTLGFRLFDFWLPVGFGAFSLLLLRLTERGQA